MDKSVLFVDSLTKSPSLLDSIPITSISDWFQQINEQYLIINRYSSHVAWELTERNVDDQEIDELIKQGIELGLLKTKWRNIRCTEVLQIDQSVLSELDNRMVYLLCRGARFNENETINLSKVLNKLSDIYAGTQVCLPKHFDVCLNIDRIWEFTFVRDIQDEMYFLNLSTVMPLQLINSQRKSKLNLFTVDDGNLSQDYFIFPPRNSIESTDLVNVKTSANDDFLCFNGEPELETIMTGDFSPLHRDDCMLDVNQIFRWSWESWRMAVGPPIQQLYPGAVQLMNIGAQNNGYHDIGEVWQEELEMIGIRSDITNLWNNVKSFYTLLHAVMRNLLRKKFHGAEKFDQDDLIPAHLLGNMWSQNWATYSELLLPLETISLEANIKKMNWTTIDMVKRAEDLYTSMGLPSMTTKFWSKSHFEKSEKLSHCHGTAANMFDANDYRMIVCAQKTLEDFYVIHHEMGHIQYYMAYSNQPPVFQEGTNTAFQESIGDVFFLAAMTPQHLNRLRLIPDKLLFPEDHDLPTEEVKEEDKLGNMLVSEDLLGYLKDLKSRRKLNLFGMPLKNLSSHRSSRRRSDEIFKDPNDFTMNSFDITLLLRMALSKIPQIPFEFILDAFRWDLFSGKIAMQDANNYFWELTKKEQGIKPPEWNSRDGLFDAGAKFHVPDNTPYVRYFLASFLQAQIFRGLCEVTMFNAVNQSRKFPMPLHRCDIYGSKRAGKLLK